VRGRVILRSSPNKYSPKFALTGFSEVVLLGSHPAAERRGPFGKVSYTCRKSALRGETMMDRERPSASELEGKIPEAWIGQEVMIETTEVLSSDLRAAAAVYLEDVNDRGIVMLVTRHRDQSQFSRYFYPWSVVGWIRLAEEDEREDPAARGSS
jgi:hypothetical protein